MYLPIPPSTIAELSAAHHQGPTPTTRRTLVDPDGFLVPEALQPDPLYMGLRTFFTTGPIGRLRSRYETWQEEREERRYAAERAVNAASQIVRQPQATSATIAARERIDHDLAA